MTGALTLLRTPHPPAAIPIPEMTADQCLDVIIDTEKTIARAHANRTRALARFADLRPPTRPQAELADGAREEVAIEIGTSPHAAAGLILHARDLVTRLPTTMNALAAGEIDYRRALAMNDLTEVLSPEDAHRVELRVLAKGGRFNPSQFRQAIRYHVIKADPAAAEKRRQAARQQRDVTLMDGLDGMGHLTADLTADEAIAAHERIDQLARRVKTPDRTLGQCRADVFRDLILGKGSEHVQVRVNVTLPMTTLLGLNDHPGELSGYGPITAAHARELAQHATWRRVLTDPTGQVVEIGRRRYASPATTEFIRIRDRYCRMPGCNTPAGRAEIDHTLRHTDHGLSVRGNLAALCKHHNLMRERSDWELKQPEAGTLVFTSPDGRQYATEPEPYPEP
jgi:hypothetical protein